MVTPWPPTYLGLALLPLLRLLLLPALLERLDLDPPPGISSYTGLRSRERPHQPAAPSSTSLASL